jgi:exopolysaccharide biosynthesis protein
MALNNYDIRHLYGKNNFSVTDKIYQQSRSAIGEFNYQGFISGIEGSRDLIKPIGPEVEWYHAGIGIRDGKIIVIHHRGSLYDLALIFKNISVENAVLLDSGGSPVIWTNQNGKGAIEYNPLYHREKRGAIIIAKMKSKQ